MTTGSVTPPPCRRKRYPPIGHDWCSLDSRKGGREGGREGGSEGGRERGREGGRERGSEGAAMHDARTSAFVVSLLFLWVDFRVVDVSEVASSELGREQGQ